MWQYLGKILSFDMISSSIFTINRIEHATILHRTQQVQFSFDMKQVTVMSFFKKELKKQTEN